MNNVKLYRTKAKMSQQMLAALAECSQPSISLIESGGGTNLALALRIAKALAVSLSDAFPEAIEAAEAVGHEAEA